MKLNEAKKFFQIISLLIIILFGTAEYVWPNMEVSITLPASGSIIDSPRIDITVNVNKIVGVNNLSLGFQLDWHRWKTFLDRPAQQQLAQNASFKIIRVFDFRPTNPRLMPCTYWNESTKTGTWNWAYADALTQKIFEIGAEPLFCLGWARDNIQKYIPPGMAVNPVTQLPYPESYAAYAAEWVKHFKQLGLPVRFYEIMNEPFSYFGWNAKNMTRLGYFVEFWNTVARAMRQQNPNILISHDTTTMRRVLDYWIQYGEDIDFLDFHKYGASKIGQYSDAEMFILAEQRKFETSSDFYGVDDARRKWFNARGKWLPIINSESNFNSAWETGTDPKIQQMAGAVWLALVLRMGILKGLDYNVYFEFSSSRSWQEAHGSGWGFGMINEDDNQPWFPYYVHKIIGINLCVGDVIIEAHSSSDEVRVLSWVHNETLNTLVICKSNDTRAVLLKGFPKDIYVLRIDTTISHEKPNIYEETISSNELLILKGYTVALLQCVKNP